MKHMASVKKNLKSNGSSTHKAKAEFAVCVKNRDHAASLELRKIYQVLPDDKGAAEGMVRVIDESGEDYLYPEDYFVSLPLPKPVQRALLLAQ